MARVVFALVTAAVLTTAACERPASDREQRRLAARALSDMLMYPRSTVTRVSAGTEAAAVTLSAPAGADAIADWYRATLVANGWELKHDGRLTDGSAVIHAAKAGRPLWVTVQPGGGAATTYTLVGVALEEDSTP
jgi:hypothetical protein